MLRPERRDSRRIERRIAASVSGAACAVIRAVDFNQQALCRSQEVRDEGQLRDSVTGRMRTSGR